MTSSIVSSRTHVSLRPFRREILVAALLLLAALTVAADRLVSTEWIDHLGMVRGLAFLGGLAGLALGWSRFPPALASAFAFAFGAFAIPWRLGLTLEDDMLWADRLVILAGRLIGALIRLARREAVQDPILFLFGMLLLFWVLSVHAGYTLTRHARPWRAILPSGLALLVIHTSDPSEASRAWYLAGYLLFSLLLLACLAYVRLRARWQRFNAHLPPLIALDFAPATVLIVVLLVLLAWSVPALAQTLPAAKEAWQTAIDPLQARMRERLDNAFASLRRAAPFVQVAGYYGEDFVLGQGGELSDVLIMTVQAPSRASPRYYWRARVYDRYEDGRWYSTAFTTTQSIPATDFVTVPELEGRKPVTLTFSLAVPTATYYAASQPRWISRPAQAEVALNPDGTADLAILRPPSPLDAGETYQVRSDLSDVTVLQLRAAGADYPGWVTDRYLEAPSTVTTRTLELASQIAAGLDNPYDVAVATTSYLRNNIEYKESIPMLLADQEPVDWFLFDLREGFCNYYASAEVILLRSAGIPARLAVGYAQGERQAGSNVYLVNQRDAHAWPEVYFPDIGWVEFEPTVSQSPLRRPSGEARPTSPSIPGREPEMDYRDRLEELLDLEDEASPADATQDSRPTWLFGIVILGLILAFLWFRLRRRRSVSIPVLLEAGLERFNLRPPAILRRWIFHANLSPMERGYLELNRALARLGAPPASSDTPAERVAALAGLLPAAAAPAQTLLNEYQLAFYSPRFGNLYVARQAARAIRGLSWRSALKMKMRRALDSVLTFIRCLLPFSR